MRKLIFIIIILLVSLLTFTCKPDSDGGDGGDDPIQYELTIIITPDGAGTVEETASKSYSKGLYDEGSVVNLTASPNEGYDFLSWSGTDDDSIVAYTNTVTMDSDKTVTATFEELTYDVTIDPTPTGGSITLDPATGPYTHGASVTVTAVPDSGYEFVEWNGDLNGSTNPTTLIMDGDKTISATFQQLSYSITIDPTPTGGSITLDPPSGPYPSGSTVTVTAVPDTGYGFVEWVGDLSGSNNPATLTMDSDKTISASFQQSAYSITIDPTPTGGSIALDPATGPYAPGSIVNVTAVPDSGYEFVEWQGDLIGSTNPTSLTMDGNKTISASFQQSDYTITIDPMPTNGSITLDPPSGPYPSGSSVTVTAVPDTGYSFDVWSGDLSGTDNPATLIMDGDKTISADFTTNQYSLTVGISNDSVGTGNTNPVPGTYTYNYNDSVTVEAIPDSGMSFVGWYDAQTGGDLVSSNSTFNFNITKDTTLYANFTNAATYSLTIDYAGNGSGNVSLNPDPPYYQGDDTVVTLSINPDISSIFTGWTDDTGLTEIIPNVEYTVVMSQNRAYEANFQLKTYTVTATTSGNGSVSGGGTVNHGDDVTLTANPGADSDFVNWTGSDVSLGTISGNQITFNNVDQNITDVVANFQLKTYTITINPTPSGGSIILDPSSGPYTHGSTVEVTANPDIGYDFVSWGGDLSGSTNPETLTMDGNKTITATFQLKSYTVTIDPSPSNGSIILDPSSGPYTHGSTVEVTANPDTGYDFVSWGGDLSGSTNPETLNMDGNKTITATFNIQTYTVSATTTGNGTVSGGGTVNYGDNVTLTANPAVDSDFVNWTGADVSLGTIVGNQITFNNVTQDITDVVANFQLKTYTVTIDPSPSNGSIILDPSSGPYTHGSTVEVTANPDTGYSFNSWGGDLSGSTNPETLTMDGNKTITATFQAETGTGTQLLLDTWEDGDLGGGSEEWFWFYATPGTTYRLHNHDDYYTHPDNPGSTNFDSELGAYEKDMVTSYTYTVPNGGTGQQDIYTSFDYIEFDSSENIVQVKATKYGGGTGSGTYWLKVTEVIPTYTISVNIDGNGSVVKRVGGSVDNGPYPQGTVVEVEAVPNGSDSFIQWTGDLTGSTNPEYITMDSNKSITAEFTGSTPSKEWLIMVYLDGANNLEGAGVEDLQEMEAGYYNLSSAQRDEIKILVLFDRISGYDTTDGNWTGTRIYEVQPDTNMSSTASTLLTGWWGTTDQEQNMGDPATLSSFINFARNYYGVSFNKEALVLWNHGGGVRSERGFEHMEKAICWDEDNGDDALYTDEVQQAINSQYSSSDKLSALGMDACLMGMVEVAYEFIDNVEYMAYSPQSEWGDGWDYEGLIGGMTPTMTAEDFVEHEVLTYRAQCLTYTYLPQTQTAVDLSNVSALKTALDNLAVALVADSRTTFETLRDNTLNYYDTDDESISYPFFDIGHLCENIASSSLNSTTKSAASSVMTALNNAVVYAWGHSNLTGGGWDGSNPDRGINVFISRGDVQYNGYSHYAYQWWYTEVETSVWWPGDHYYGLIDFCDSDADGTVEYWREMFEYWYDSSNSYTPSTY
jgi:uncharacterized repeat protein (TIGR02543 family)